MKNTKCLILVNGFFGDIAFSTAIARKLKEEEQYSHIDYLIGFPQMIDLINNDPNIDNVYLSEQATPYPNLDIIKSSYDNIIKIGQMTFSIPPPTEMQIMAGVRNPDTQFYLYTNSTYDDIAQNTIEQLKKDYGKPVVCVLSNWEERSFIFTKEQYIRGINVPNLGYGGKHRNINYIIKLLSKHFTLVEVGFPPNTHQIATIDIPNHDQKSILFECSIIKYCDAFVGAEGGLCNLAAGVGTKTIITGDFVHQLYGWNGVIKKIKEPKLGPKYYFPNAGHIELNPYLTDNEVAKQIIKSI